MPTVTSVRTSRVSAALLAASFCLVVSNASAQEQWTRRYPLPTDADLNAVAWSGTQLVIVGAHGTILSGPDAGNLSERISGSTADLYGVAWTDSVAVAVGDKGAVLVSRDATTWTSANSGSGQKLNAVCWTRSVLVAVGDSGTILTSPDAVTWTPRSSGCQQHLRALVWTGSQVVVVGDGGAVVRSPDGLTWTSYLDTTKTQMRGVAWTGSMLVAVGVGRFLTSPDGAAWASCTSGVALEAYAAVWTGRQVVAVGDGRFLSLSPAVWLSPDGRNGWVRRLAGQPATVAVAVADTQLVAVGPRGLVQTSSDGVAWATRSAEPTGMGSFCFRGIAWTGSLLAAVGTWVDTCSNWMWCGDQRRSSIFASQEFVTWTQVHVSYDAAYAIVWTGARLAMLGSRSWAVPNSMAFCVTQSHVSPDGTHWADTGGSDAYCCGEFAAIAWTGSQLVAVGGFIAGTDSAGLRPFIAEVSANGSSWHASGGPIFGSLPPVLHGITWTGSQLVAVGDSGAVLTSPDAITWTSRSSGCTLPLRAVAWRDSELVAVGDSGALLTSPDGITWSRQNPDVTTALLAVTWTGGMWVCVGDSGTIITSMDGTTWTRRNSTTTRALHAVVSTPTQTVAVGDAGIVLTSPNVTAVRGTRQRATARGLGLTVSPVSRQQLSLSFTLDRPAAVSATVFDLHGRAVCALPARAVAAGEQHVSMPMTSLASGTYRVAVITGKTRTVLPLLLTR